MKTPIILFFSLMLIIASVLCLFPIKMFDGEVIYQVGEVDKVLSGNLSLSYFFGLGYDPREIVGVQDFYLTTKGWITAGIFIVGFPFLVAFRVYLRRESSKLRK